MLEDDLGARFQFREHRASRVQGLGRGKGRE